MMEVRRGNNEGGAIPTFFKKKLYSSRPIVRETKIIKNERIIPPS